LGFSEKYSVVAAEARKAQAGDAPYIPGVPKAELARHHAREKVDRALEAVHELEEKPGILDHWTSESLQWTTTVQQIKQNKCQIQVLST
jgi:ABC-type amino acid transport substrate-binding protein